MTSSVNRFAVTIPPSRVLSSTNTTNGQYIHHEGFSPQYPGPGIRIRGQMSSCWAHAARIQRDGGTTRPHLRKSVRRHVSCMVAYGGFSVDEVLSKEACARAGNPGALVSIVQRFSGQDGVIGMHYGLPPASVFPISSLSFTCAADPVSYAKACTSAATAPMERVPDSTIPGVDSSHDALTIDDPDDMAAMQQYNLDVYGHPELRAWLRKLVYHVHKPARNDLEVLLAAGCYICLDKIIRMFIDDGECVLVEESMFCSPLETAILPRGCKPEVVAMDDGGITPEGLEVAIHRSISSTGRAPKLMYLVPHCQNPTGSSMSMRRKREIYALCHQHNIVILEDDPYAFLQFPSEHTEMPGFDVEAGFLAMDTDGRVIRIDSFSKFLAPGFRLAWITSTPAIIEHCVSATYLPTAGPSGMSQEIANSMLRSWGLDGFNAHLKTIQAVYRERALCLVKALEQDCGDRLTITMPAGGMFLWVEVPFVEDTEELMDLMVAHKVAVVPGRFFSARADDPTYKCKFVRMAYAYCTLEELQEGARRFAAVLNAHLEQHHLRRAV